MKKKSLLILLVIFFLGFATFVFAATNLTPTEMASGSKVTSINPQIKNDGVEADVVVPDEYVKEPTPVIPTPPFIPEFEDTDPFVDMEISRDFSQTYDYTTATISSVRGSFDILDGVYTSSTDSALYVNMDAETPFPYGTISASVKNNGGDSGLVFGLSSNYDTFWEGSGVSYYFLFVSLGGDLYLGRTVDGVWSELARADIAGFNAQITYNIKVIYLVDKIIVYLDDVYQFSYRVSEALEGTGWGIRTGVSGATFSNVSVSSDVKLS